MGAVVKTVPRKHGNFDAGRQQPDGNGENVMDIAENEIL